MRNTFHYVLRQSLTILWVFMIYKPRRFFGFLGLGPFILGLLLGVRFLYYYATGQGQGHVQSLILSSILLTIGFQLGLLALLADLIAVNRSIMEEVRYRLRKTEGKDREKAG